MVTSMHQWQARAALVLAIIVALLNAVVVFVYGWLLGAMFTAFETGEGLWLSPGTVTHGTPLLLVVGELWYFTPPLSLVAIMLALGTPRERSALAAIILSILSLLAFAIMLARFMTGSF